MGIGGNFPGDAAELTGSARWHVHQVLPTGRAEAVTMTREAYTRSDFLDHRIHVPQGAAVAALDFARLTPLFAEAGKLRTSYIFHISHVGSTLLSKALATRPTVLGLREPQLLRWTRMPARSQSFGYGLVPPWMVTPWIRTWVCPHVPGAGETGAAYGALRRSASMVAAKVLGDVAPLVLLLSVK